MRALLIGNVLFSKHILETLLNMPDLCQLVGIVTKSKSSYNNDHYDLAPIAINNGIPYKYVKDINQPHILSWIKAQQPEIIFCMGWSQLLSREVLELPRLGVIGYHPAMIPQNRGRHPLIWALALGLNETGSSFFKMDVGADSGEIISQKIINISNTDDAGSLYIKMIQVAKAQISSLVYDLVNGRVEYKPQNLAQGNIWRKRTRFDGLIDFRMTSISIYNLVRALTAPYPGAEVKINDEYHKVERVRVGNNTRHNLEPGLVLAIEGTAIEVKTSDGSIWLIDHSLPLLPQIGQYFQ